MMLRPYYDADLQSLADLFTASVHELAADHYDAVQRSAWAPQPPDIDFWQQRLSRVQTIVAEEDGRLAGFISYEPDGHIDLLYTSPEFPRRGVASMLYRHVESALAAAGVEEIFTEASLVARPFFEHQGFHVTEEQIVHRGGVAFRRCAMRKGIAAARHRM